MSKSAETLKILVPALAGTGAVLAVAVWAAGAMTPDGADVPDYVPVQLTAPVAPDPEPEAVLAEGASAPAGETEADAVVERAEAGAAEEAPEIEVVAEAPGPGARKLEVVRVSTQDDPAPDAPLAAVRAPAGGYGLGRPALPEEVAAWDIDIRPDGTGLPPGSGDVPTGEEVYTDRCAACHGDFGEGVGRWPVLMGGLDTLDGHDPVKTPGSYWPYLSTVWDYVHRAMPFGDAQSLTDDEVYALTAYILYLNDLVDDDFELSSANFGAQALPNEGNFYPDDRPETELAAFSAEPCMEECGEERKIVMRARVLDVTPEEAEAEDEAPGTEGDGALVAAPPAQGAPGTAIDAELAAAGEAVFRKCKSCHMVGEDAKNRTGPMLTEVLGAPVGGVEGFRYSKAFIALNEAGEVWDAASLSAFLEKPKDWAKGTKMSFQGLRSEEDRAAVIEYLRSVAR